MVWRRLFWEINCVLVAAAISITGATHANAQISAAGVEVDAAGVLRTKVLRDPTGALTRRRLAEAKASLTADVARPSKLRKVSLNRLEAAIAERAARGEEPTDDMRYLVGMTRLEHVFYYPETRDVVIAGPAEGYATDLSGRAIGIVSGQSVLELQDVIVALRAFPPSGEHTAVISVSIDPTREGLVRMQQFLSAISGRVTPGDAGRIAAGLRENLGLQTVTVRGISPKTHFAQVLVEADYRMKLIGIGLESPPVDIGSYVARANSRAVARNALQRWYFVPNYECVRVSDDDLAMELVGEGVRLVGENEMVDAGGGRAGSAVVDRASQAFVTAFTAKYPELARKSPVYAQLRNLIDMAIAAAFIQHQDYYGQADWKLELFGREDLLPLENYETPQQVETAVNAVWKGNTLMTPVGGGVRIEALQALASDRILPDERGQLKQLHEKTKTDGLVKGQWWWD